MRTRGKVIKKRVAEGSKSDREAVCLVTPRGVYILQRVGGHPFQDEVLDDLVGRNVSCSGSLQGHTLIMQEWKVLEG